MVVKKAVFVVGLSSVVLACGFGFSDPTPQKTVKPYKPVDALFKAKCISCHSEKGHAGGVDLTTYKAVLKGKKTIVVPGKPEKSDVLAYIDGTKKPLMPMGGKKLADADIKLVRDWIKAGAKN